MLRHAYPPVDLFSTIPDLGLAFDPLLAHLDRLLDDDALIQPLTADLARRSPLTTRRGRSSTPVEVVLRMLIVKRLYHWSYEETEQFVRDSLVLRQFCRVYPHRVPDDTTLMRWANLIEPETLDHLNDRVVALARSLKVTRGRRLRVDRTVVETTIHHPTDSGLLADGVRVLRRLARRAKAVIGQTAGLGRAAFRSHVRGARRVVQRLQRVARRKGDAAAEELKTAYAALLTIARSARRQAAPVGRALQAQGTAQATRLADQVARFLPLVEQVIDQAERRVLRGEVVPAEAKLVSLFEPHTQVIRRCKPGKPVEFGRQLFLDEVEGGILSGFAIAAQPGQDQPYPRESLAGHRRRFGRSPTLLAGDRGFARRPGDGRAAGAGTAALVPARLPVPGRDRGTGERAEAGV